MKDSVVVKQILYLISTLGRTRSILSPHLAKHDYNVFQVFPTSRYAMCAGVFHVCRESCLCWKVLIFVGLRGVHTVQGCQVFGMSKHINSQVSCSSKEVCEIEG
ncbi:hypothetical protein, unlikely [Trypanosoma brucei gambiense DAL972]|uniref:Uncharacterized protein n=1 Tax=Trypanosoma brucei gambiense (strain MHOM/CI/86/DAL972) TaxID=679716 RepID=D0A3X6_TRYB9|nr:hypothetical protein, unlikely [Trypanosoma brucei gambiense DAL972]CBH15970.1 hypothetical protein, unlikely [Trypanosoma brucei gambiense DAL972]|eukprot:XP_011778234.1 hypothetical protein, unlikely [Trypanosoma brucei gambiense DAL972]